MAMASSSLVSSVFSNHKPVSWSDMTADTDVRLVDLDADSQVFVSVRNQIQLTLRCGDVVWITYRECKIHISMLSMKYAVTSCPMKDGVR